MLTQDPRLAAELRFDTRELEPSSVLVEQLSVLAVTPGSGTPVGRRFSRRAAAGVFAGLLLASGTAYAARDQIAPAWHSIVGQSHHEAPPKPKPSVPPQGTDQHPQSPAPAVGTKAGDGSQGQQDTPARPSQGQQPDGGSGAGNAQQSGSDGQGNGGNRSSSNGAGNSPGSSGGDSSGGAPTSGDGSSVGQ